MREISIVRYKIYRFLRKTFLLIGLFFVLLFIFTTLVVTLYSKDIIYTNPEDILGQKIVLVLGTSKYAISGQENLFYQNRIMAAAELYQAGKVEKFILSGHINDYYNEPKQMTEDLMKLGVPEDMFIKDEVGDRTIDSILNLKNNYNINNNIIIVSQNFHVRRALLLTGIYDIEALGFSAKSPSLIHGYKTYPREILARIKLLWDITSR